MHYIAFIYFEWATHQKFRNFLFLQWQFQMNPNCIVTFTGDLHLTFWMSNCSIFQCVLHNLLFDNNDLHSKTLMRLFQFHCISVVQYRQLFVSRVCWVCVILLLLKISHKKYVFFQKINAIVSCVFWGGSTVHVFILILSNVINICFFLKGGEN